MTRVRETDGAIRVEAASYVLELGRTGTDAWLFSPQGDRLACLRPAAAFDTTAARDETLAVEPPRVLDEGATVAIEVARRSTVWERATTTIVCTDEQLELRSRVGGRGTLLDVHQLGFRALFPDGPNGFQSTISNFRTLFSPNPGDAARILRPAGERLEIGVTGDGALGRGHFFFTPAPLYLALTTEARDVDSPVTSNSLLLGRGGDWLDLGVVAPVAELTFSHLVYEAGDRLFSLRLDYEGHTGVDGDFEAPAILLTPGVPDPATGLRRHRDDLAARSAAPPVAAREAPGWWSQPMFCGWGAQVHVAREAGVQWGSVATQESYDGFLEVLERNGVVPGTIVIDDKWQATYGGNEVDEAKWPDLAGWIAARHARGQKVLLWWKAWDPEGVAPELCLRTPDGVPAGLDPSNPETQAALTAMVARLLGPEGLDADGLKVDFTGRTPVGQALVAHGSARGIALLHELLRVVYAAAKAAKPDALMITQAPHPAFADVADMIRLNDMLRIDDPGPPQVVEQMRYRAAVVRAACPELLVDTDDWQAPSRAEWRRYLRAKIELGVPALYYATHLDATGEPLEPADYAALRTLWGRQVPA
jgi:hypothetical protein